MRRSQSGAAKRVRVMWRLLVVAAICVMGAAGGLYDKAEDRLIIEYFDHTNFDSVVSSGTSTTAW